MKNYNYSNLGNFVKSAGEITTEEASSDYPWELDDNADTADDHVDEGKGATKTGSATGRDLFIGIESIVQLVKQ